MKKVKSSWSSCPQCNVILSNRFLKRHEKDHSTQHVSDLSGNACSGDGLAPSTPSSMNRSMVDSLLSPQKSSFEYGFFAEGNLHAVVTSSKLESEPQLPKSMQSHIAFFSPGTMRVGKMAIGDPVAINGKYTYLAWPNSSVPDCFVYVQPNDRVSQGRQSLPPGQMCTVNRLPDVIPAAGRVRVRLDQGGSVLPSSVTADHLSLFIKHQLDMKVISSECDMTIGYFGKPISVQIVEVTAKDGLVVDADSLCQDMDNLNVTAEVVTNEDELSTSLVTSTPVSGRSKAASPPRDSPALEGGLAIASGTFYQVQATTVVVLEDCKAREDMTPAAQSKQVPVVAGADGILHTLNQLIVEPISKRSMYDRYGVQVPRGALLHGPSGCGKTLIANTIGQKLKGHAEFITLDPSQLWSKQFGETENRLQNIFQQAIDNSPAVIFIDDIDVICPRRERSQSDLEKRVLSSLVAEIDRVSQSVSSYVFILATTNKLDAVDMTLRRPGRIDRELEVPVPSSNQRKKILTTMLDTMLHGLSEADISEIAADCHGYVGADLQSLCREAGLSAMEARKDDGINLSHFKQAMSTVQPSAMREIYIDVPKVMWTDIGGQESLKQSLIQSIIWPLQHADRFKKLGIKPPRGVLMYGPPGCSKTMIAKALATETSLNFISIKGPELFSKWVGDSEKAVREIFRKARSAAPSIVFFDEIDAVAVERGRQQGSGGGVGDRVLAQLLTELDGVEGLNNVNIVAATNRPDMIDKALMRPGRLDRLVYVPLPDEKTRQEIFKLRLKTVPLADDVHFMELVDKTRMYSGAEIVAVCNEAAMIAMQQNMEADVVEREHLLAALRSIKPQTTESMVKYYTDYAAGINK